MAEDQKVIGARVGTHLHTRTRTFHGPGAGLHIGQRDPVVLLAGDDEHRFVPPLGREFRRAQCGFVTDRRQENERTEAAAGLRSRGVADPEAAIRQAREMHVAQVDGDGPGRILERRLHDRHAAWRVPVLPFR